MLLTALKAWEFVKTHWYALLAFVLSMVIVCLVLIADHKERKYQDAVKQHTEYVAKQLTDTQNLNLSWQAKLNKVNEEYVDRVKSLNAERDDLLADVRLLESNLTTAERKFATATTNAKLEYTKALGNVYQECISEYSALAVKADGHVLDAERLRNSWPQIKEPP